MYAKRQYLVGRAADQVFLCALRTLMIKRYSGLLCNEVE